MNIKLDETNSISLDYIFNNFTTTILVFGGNKEDVSKAYAMDSCELQRRIGLFMNGGVLMHSQLFEVDCTCYRAMLVFSNRFSLTNEDNKIINEIYDIFSNCNKHPDEEKHTKKEHKHYIYERQLDGTYMMKTI